MIQLVVHGKMFSKGYIILWTFREHCLPANIHISV